RRRSPDRDRRRSRDAPRNAGAHGSTRRPAPAGGECLIVYAVAIICLIVAAVASGLIAPGVATHVAEAQASTREMLMAVLPSNGQVNQAFAKLGFALASLAIILWSTAMFRDRFSRALGVYGILMAVIVLAGLGLS